MALEQTVKQRLIGAIVLVAVAVIFLPGILGQKKERKTFVSQVPEKPFSESKMPVKRNDETTESSQSKTEQLTSNEDNRQAENSGQLDESTEKENQKEKSFTEKRESERQNSTKDPSAQSVSENKPSVAVQSNNDSTSERAISPKKQKKTVQSAKKKPSPVADSGLKENSWVVQVGSFSSHANAELLSKRLEEQRLKAFVRPVELEKDQLLYRVYVGPWLKKEQAEKQLANITDITRLSPIVVAWNPQRQ
ncbi:SPOR domain-containing protein [Pleionea sediminis]|uniref:SPOR domain-containing protein n=1 Tax=Pleionea sediminis TaxID=2569479 RepID=UPI0011860A95|nr:SPOR domain-containing protein [Pleionea sediminis]